MANPLIPLQTEVPDVGVFQNALLRGRADRRAQAENERRQAQAERESELQPLRIQALQQSLESGGLDLETERFLLQNQRQVLAGEMAKHIKATPKENRTQMAELLERSAKASGQLGENETLADDDIMNDAFLDSLISGGDAARAAITASMKPSSVPARIQEFQFRERLTPNEQQAFDHLVRAPTTVTLGDVPAVLTPTDPTVAQPVQTGSEPETQEEIQERLTQQEAEKQKRIAESKETGKAFGQAIVDLPRVTATTASGIEVIDQALNHPGLEAATGASSRLDPRNFLPGTDAYSFNVLMDQIRGKTFLQAFQSLRGGGQITNIEGDKATAAIGRLNTGQKTDDFVEALGDLKEVLQAGQRRAEKAAGKAEEEILKKVSPKVRELWDHMTPEEKAAFQ